MVEDEITFELEEDIPEENSEETETVEDQTKKQAPKEDLGKRISKLEKAVIQVVTYLKKQSVKNAETPKIADKPVEVVEEKKPNPIEETVKELKKQYESMSEKVKDIENTPRRLAQLGATEDTNSEKRVQEFLSNVTGAEILVYAEKNKIPWGVGNE